MKVVLTDHVKGLGQKGEVIEVKEGYYRNFLAPKRLAAVATQSKLAHIQAQQAKSIEKLEAMEESAKAVKAKIDGKSITLTEKAGDGGHLYAAVSPKEIAAGIKEELKAEVPEKAVMLEENIKEPGDFPITIKLHKNVAAEIKLHVIAK